MDNGVTNFENAHATACIDATVWIEGTDRHVAVHKGYRWWTAAHDTGGKTCAGIASKWYEDEKAAGLPSHRSVIALWSFVEGCEAQGVVPHPGGSEDEQTLYKRLIGLVRDVYQPLYWDEMRCGSLPDHWRVRWSLFDCSVNFGVPTASRWVQGMVGAKIDGDVGNKTVGAICAFVQDKGPDRFNQAIRNLRQNHAHFLGEKYSHQVPNVRGWVNRADKVAEQAVLHDADTGDPA